MAYNTLRSPLCDDCPSCRTCVLWDEDFDLHGSRPLAAGEVEPVSWTGFTLTAGTHAAAELPTISPIESPLCEGFSLNGAISRPEWLPYRELRTTATGTVSVESPVNCGYRVSITFTVDAGAGDTNGIEFSLTAGLARLVVYRYQAANGIAKLYVDDVFVSVETFNWPSTGGQFVVYLDVFVHARTGSMVYAHFGAWAPGGITYATLAELFAPCDARGVNPRHAITFAIDANPDACLVHFESLKIEAHNSEANDAEDCPRPDEPCSDYYYSCHRPCETQARVQVDLPAECGGGSYVLAGGGISTRTVAPYWLWINEDPEQGDIASIMVERDALTETGLYQYTTHLWINVIYYDPAEVGYLCDRIFRNFDPDDPQPWPAPSKLYCEHRLGLGGKLDCSCERAWDFDCSASSWVGWDCYTVLDPYGNCTACNFISVTVTPLGCS